MSKKIIIYTKVARNVSGVQTFEKNLIKTLSANKNIKLVYLYEVAEAGFLDEIKEFAEILQNTNQELVCDTLIYSSVFHASNSVRAKKTIQVIHSDLKFWGVNYYPQNIDLHISVSESVAMSLKKDFNVDSVVIDNILPVPKLKKVLKLLTASRIAEGKGFERVVKVARELKEKGILFTWYIFGDNYDSYAEGIKEQLENIKEVVFMGARSNIQNYMQYIDYVVQLSDSEGFCYSIHEALQIGKPVIVTKWQGLKIDDTQGYLLEMDLSNLDVNQIYEFIKNPYTHKSNPDLIVRKWLDVL